jgi:hypothetical protein
VGSLAFVPILAVVLFVIEVRAPREAPVSELRSGAPS